MKKVLETERLIIRQFIPEDTGYIYKLHNDPDVMKYISTKKSKEVTRDECKSFIEGCRKYYKKHPGLGIWAAQTKASGDFIGWTALKDLDNTEDIEVGYRLLKEFWGNGYATESSKALIEYGFNELKLNKLVAVALPENTASVRVLVKAGMEYKGIKKYYNADVVFYQIYNPSRED